MSLTLRVDYDPEAASSRRDPTLSLEASRLLTTEEVCSSIHQQLVQQGEVRLSPDSYALYWPDKKVWLKTGSHIGRMLKKNSSARLEYRQRRRLLKIRFLDASSKQVTVDETLTVGELVRDVCAQLDYDHPEELSFVVAGDYAITKHHPAKLMTDSTSQGISPRLGRKKNPLTGSDSSLAVSPKIRRKSMSSLARPSSASGGRPGSAGKSRRPSSSQLIPKKKQISKKHQMRIDTPWLDPTRTLLEQEVTADDEVILMYRFHYHIDLVSGSNACELLYKQARATFLSGELLCSQHDLVMLSALLCQIIMGDFTTKEETVERVHKMKTVVAPPKCKIKSLAKEVASRHSSLKGLSACDARSWFVKMWSSMELFGMEFFSCVNTDTKDNGLVGVSRNKIKFLFYNTKKKNMVWDYSRLLRWHHDTESGTVLLSFTNDGMTDQLKLSLPDYAGVMMDCLNGHRDLSSALPILTYQQQQYMLTEDMETAYHSYTAGQVGEVRPQSLTYNHIYWASMIENPLMSEEDVSQVSWENPAFENMDKLMEERFSFLDFKEYSTDDSSVGVSPSTSPYPDRLSVDLSSAAGSASESSLTTLSHQMTQEVSGAHSPLIKDRRYHVPHLAVQDTLGSNSTASSPRTPYGGHSLLNRPAGVVERVGGQAHAGLQSHSSPTISVSHESRDSSDT